MLEMAYMIKSVWNMSPAGNECDRSELQNQPGRES